MYEMRGFTENVRSNAYIRDALRRPHHPRPRIHMRRELQVARGLSQRLVLRLKDLFPRDDVDVDVERTNERTNAGSLAYTRRDLFN